LKILLAYGTRPELIKLAPLIFELKGRKNADLLIVNTGQHKEMVDELEKVFGIKPDLKLSVMTPNQSLNLVLSSIVMKISEVFHQFKPDLVIVQGDTTTVLSIGISAFYSQIKVAHVEAGLRSHDVYNPYPEEFNRRVVSLFASFNFAPTALSAKNLLKEKVNPKTVFVTGNTGVDAVQMILKKRWKNKNQFKGRKILITAHRRENHGKGIENICKAVIALLKTYPDIEFTWPVHPNPNVFESVEARLGKTKRVHLCQPLPYEELIREINESFLLWTDSGGIQEEAPSLKKPVLILRSVTERPEVIRSGFGILVGTDPTKILMQTKKLLSSKKHYAKMVSGKNPFGNGKASARIADILLKNE